MNLIFCVLWCCVWSGSLAHNGSFMRLVGVGKPNLTTTTRSLIIENKWFKQKVDHFNPSDKRTWNQRYQMNLKYYKHGGPIFLNIGGEEEISHDWMTSGAWIEYAKKCNAICFQLEHRYYGRSHPTDNLNTNNLMYLTIEQALADLETFIRTISKDNEALNAKWVVFGGSYSGSLAAWLRMKYPHLVHAAVSSSSPLKAKINYKEYYMVVQNVLSTYNPRCASYIRSATLSISDLLKYKDGAKYINSKFKTCSSIPAGNQKDKTQLLSNLALPIAQTVQYNKGNIYNGNASSALEGICNMMLDRSLGNPLERYTVVHEKLRSVNNQKCLSGTYETALSAFKKTSWNSGNVKTGDRQMLYQVCTEIGNFVTSNNFNHLFSDTIPLNFFIDMCKDVFGTFNSTKLHKAIKKTNEMYQILKNKTSRIIYLHGSVDPWNRLGLTRLNTKDSISITIKGVSHCADTYPSQSLDPPQLTKARETVTYYVQKWLKEKN
ncbi:putative serine protease K12H4.7 [Myzus persicae]|uniref:putative serine protease K12H4.7 n=1 Tax=Myzus persicae TaxID=13164 RepID=UPI000B930E82|nr:putative serine protease K12H4.7 [Myzus persicae]